MEGMKKNVKFDMPPEIVIFTLFHCFCLITASFLNAYEHYG